MIMVSEALEDSPPILLLLGGKPVDKMGRLAAADSWVLASIPGRILIGLESRLAGYQPVRSS